MQEKLHLYIFVSVLFIMGIVFGALMVNALSADQIKEMSHYLGQFFQLMEQEADGPMDVLFRESLAMHLKWLLLVSLLGISVIGLPIILVLDFVKGVLLGFTVGYFVGQLSWQGVLFALFSIAPQNLLIVPALIICSVSGISLSVYIFKNRILLRRQGRLSEQFKQYAIIMLSLAIIVALASLFEAFISPILMKWVI